MTIFSEFGSRGSRRHRVDTRAFALEQLVSIHTVTFDLRWAMVELAWHSVTAMVAFTRARLLTSARGHHTPREEDGGRRQCCC